MNYYKLINNMNIIGVASSFNFRRFQEKHRIILICDEQSAQYVQYKDILYHDNWMSPITSDLYKYESAKVIQIDEQEYNTLKTTLETEDEIVIESDIPIEEEPEYVNPNDVVTIDYVRGIKVAEMSNTCNKVITNGFDVFLSDGNLHHFSLTTQDQLNLITLSSMIASGEEQIPYHADGELCRFYSVEDVNIIISAATQFKTYQISYFNTLKAYIESLGDIDEICAITYGIEIPAEYQSDVLKVLLANMAISGDSE